jgi:hypothetical protein
LDFCGRLRSVRYVMLISRGRRLFRLSDGALKY